MIGTSPIKRQGALYYLVLAGQGLCLQVRAYICRFGLVFPSLGLYLQAWAYICWSGLIWACMGRPVWACTCSSGLNLQAWICICKAKLMFAGLGLIGFDPAGSGRTFPTSMSVLSGRALLQLWACICMFRLEFAALDSSGLFRACICKSGFVSASLGFEL